MMPLSHRDPNGHPEPVKSVSIQIAEVVTREFLSKLNHLIDFHSGGDNHSVHMIEFTDDPVSTSMARAFNMPILLRDVWMPGQMWTMAETFGVSTIVAELGGNGTLYHEWVARGVAGTLNVMRSLGMLPGEVVPRTTPVCREQHTWTRGKPAYLPTERKWTDRAGPGDYRRSAPSMGSQWKACRCWVDCSIPTISPCARSFRHHSPAH